MKIYRGKLSAALACSLYFGTAAVSVAAYPAAEQPTGPLAVAPQAGIAPLRDVALGSGGRLEGVLLDRQGVPRAAAPVVLISSGQEVGSATTDATGRFAISGLRGGEYTLAAGEDQTRCRLWAEGTAPPSAQGKLQLYGGDLVRGRHYGVHNVLTSPAVIGAAVGTAIAVPLALHNREPAS